MNVRILSFVVIFFCCLFKVLSLFWIFVLFLCFLLTFAITSAVFLSNATGRHVTNFMYGKEGNPLDNRIDKQMGLKYCFQAVAQSEHDEILTKQKKPEPIRKKSLEKHYSHHGLAHKLDVFIDHFHLTHHRRRKNSLDHSHVSSIKVHGERRNSHQDEIESTDMKHLKKPPDAPKKKMKQLTSNKTVDKLIHTIIDYILRDFIDDWFLSVSDNNDFSLETRTIIENFIINFTKRIQQTPLVSIMTTKLIDDIAMHAKKYRQASQIVKESRTVQNITKSPTKFNPPLHRRNKSETDVTWNIGSANIQRNVANSTFFSVQTDEKLLDPEKQLLEVFFENFQGLYKEESTSDEALQRHLTSVIETILYFTMQRNDFNCDSLRLLVSTLLANVLCKSIDAMSDPDFINLQIAHNFSVEPPAAEFLIKMIRQTNDLSELRSVRQLLTREMDSKYKDPNTISGELASLKFTQKIIDIRISSIQNNRIDMSGKKLFERDRTVLKVPQLPLDEILTKELALSYYLDYLSILNLQKYVIFYLLAQDWKFTVSERLTEASNDESQRMQILKHYRDKAFEMYRDYLIPSSVNYLNIDPGLIEVIHIRIKDTFIQPEVTWFDSICKFVYEKLKNEDVFLQNFYQSSAYKKLLVELEESEVDQPEVKLLENQESESDSNSGDFLIDDMDFLEQCEVQDSKLLNPHIHRHHRSHSDTGVINLKAQSPSESNGNFGKRLQAKIINSAINSDGKFAVYAIQVTVIEQDPDGSHQQKSWHIYRRYSKFLELKKFLVRRFVQFQQIQLPFPKKQTFHNTNRSVLERRMMILNEFLMVICDKAGADDSLNVVIRDFLEPDQDDRQIHGTKVIRHIVNPIKSGMKTIKSMPDTVFGGFSRIFMAKNVNKLPFDEIDGHSSDYPSLVSFVSLLDAVFDLESRSQWLKKGIQRLLGAPWVSQSVNRKIQETAQRLIEPDKVEAVLNGILSNIWPDGIHKDPVPREDNTKLRTRMAAKIVLFTFFSDELKHFLGSETTRLGLMTFFEMLQYRQLNKRLILVLLHRLLIAIFPTDNMTKHIVKDN